MNKTLWLVVPVAGLASGLLAAAATPRAEDPQRAALEAAAQRWTTAVNALDVGALTATMTEDVEILDDATTASGREAAIRALRQLAARGQLLATSREITIVRDVAWRLAELTQTRRNGDVQALGQTLEIWKWVKGTWQLHRQMAAGILAVKDSLSRPPPGEPVLDRPRN